MVTLQATRGTLRCGWSPPFLSIRLTLQLISKKAVRSINFENWGELLWQGLKVERGRSRLDRQKEFFYTYKKRAY